MGRILFWGNFWIFSFLCLQRTPRVASTSCWGSKSELPKRLEMQQAGDVCWRIGTTHCLGRFCMSDGGVSYPSEMTRIPLKYWRRQNVVSQQACNAAERTDLHFLPRLKRAKPKKGIGDCHFRKKRRLGGMRGGTGCTRASHAFSSGHLVSSHVMVGVVGLGLAGWEKRK